VLCPATDRETPPEGMQVPFPATDHGSCFPASVSISSPCGRSARSRVAGSRAPRGPAASRTVESAAAVPCTATVRRPALDGGFEESWLKHSQGCKSSLRSQR